jgi:hydroxyacyl-ACP dehydratase HTD2-like protein with hotdog domain
LIVASHPAQLPELVAAITRQDLVRYAGAANDYLPQHWDQAMMQGQGFADVVVHGWLGCAHLLRAATATLTPDRWWLARYSVRYLQTLYPGEVRFGGDILGSGAGECTVNGWIKDAAGNLVTTAQLIFTDRLGQAVV